jgi:hypothetical protein
MTSSASIEDHARDGKTFNDRQRLFEGRLDQALRFMPPDRFEAMIRRLPWQEYFDANFARLAPQQWAELMKFIPLATEAETLRAQGNHAAAAFHENMLEALVRHWAAGCQIQTAWFIATAMNTLRLCVYCDAFEQPRPKELDSSGTPIVERVGDDQIAFGIERPLVDPWLRVVVDLNMGTEDWNPTKETPAQLRKRLERQCAKHIDAQVKEATTLSTKSTKVNRKAVDWMILRRACKWSDNQINNWYRPGKDNRKEISKQIPEAEAALEIR